MTVVCLISFLLISELCYSQLNFGVEQEVLMYPYSTIFYNSFKPKEIILQGGINAQVKNDKRIRFAGFLNYYFYRLKSDWTPYTALHSNMLYNNLYTRDFFLHAGPSINFFTKNKNQSFNFALGLGGGVQTNISENILLNKKKSWCLSAEISYKFYLKKLYLKPFIGVLNCFTFRDYNYYNDGTIIDDKILDFYSSTNPFKKNFYKSSKTNTGKDLIIDYYLFGIKNPYYLPSLMFSVGYTF